MSSQKLTLNELLDLIELEGYRGIIDADAVLQMAMEKGIPRVVSDIRGALRLAVERAGEDFQVTQYPTELAMETVGEIYPSASKRSPANDNSRADVDMAA